MPRNIDKDPTQFFSVVGAPYLHEHHSETARYSAYSDLEPARGVASAWLLLYTAIVGISLFASSGSAKLVEVATR